MKYAFLFITHAEYMEENHATEQQFDQFSEDRSASGACGFRLSTCR